MSHNRPPRPGDSRNDEFGDALDDIFGTAPVDDPPEPQHDEPAVVYAPDPAAVAQPPSSPYQPPASYPLPQTPSPARRQQRPLSRMIGIGCVVIAVLGFACTAILTIIGLLVGDDDPGASPVVGAPVFETVSTTRDDRVVIPANPVPIGEYVDLNEKWRVAVTATLPDATDEVLAINEFNTPPEHGHQFFIATVSIENRGTAAEFFPASFLFRAIGQSGTEYATFDDFCGVIPDSFTTADIRPGATMEGNVCWSVAGEDVGSLVMRSDEFLGSYTEHFFTLTR